ncbi:MAG TPA: phosphoribosylglycinamide formyltransferase [Gemmatimonadetes bacterium]|nr:phosphoribosylglycinamide formyltransferase [Gemmatimonadota bacterium]
MTQGRGPFRVAVFASGGGSNFQSLINHVSSGDRAWSIDLLVMNREGGALRRARSAGVPVHIIPTKGREMSEIAQDTLRVLDEHAIDIVLLAGYLRFVPSEVTSRFSGRILNIHPALLPEFGGPGMYGMNVHRAVADSESTKIGATIHFVSDLYDEGAILGQWRMSRRPEDSAEEIAAKVLKIEHRLYPAAVDHLCDALIADTRPVRMVDVGVKNSFEEHRRKSSTSIKLTEEIQ